MLSPGGRHPLQHHAAGSALSRRLVGDQQRYGRSWHTLDAGSEPLVGGWRRVAWYVTQAADTQAMMLAMVDVAVGTCG
jgi:predicted NBD/HSP70 family sugar kinase